MAVGGDRSLLHLREAGVGAPTPPFRYYGHVKTDRSGYAKDVVTAKDFKTVNKKKVMVPPQGTIKLAQNKQIPQLTAAMWVDRTPVDLLSSGGSRKNSTVSKYYVH
ncbi:hypothetical protein PF008_g2887 [Phytophthora fragariae]|uniref:Uncharacterized protein n=1 Tax=Phytophthora fragariae TaxID=53985 RepID=A0A6G0SFS5_9STRA|nr:hypothetical protein PF008_g2887 [Phytophthora fragariae]